MFWVRNLHPERVFYGNVDITLLRHLLHCYVLQEELEGRKGRQRRRRERRAGEREGGGDAQQHREEARRNRRRRQQ